MKLAEYMDPQRFPLTTQEGLKPRDQMMLDAFNFDDIAAAEEMGRPITNAALIKELTDKRDARAEVLAELKVLENASKDASAG